MSQRPIPPQLAPMPRTQRASMKRGGVGTILIMQHERKHPVEPGEVAFPDFVAGAAGQGGCNTSENDLGRVCIHCAMSLVTRST